MINVLYLPELREMLAEGNTDELREFCSALHPARTAEFMEGLTADEAWQVLLVADWTTRVEIFVYFPVDIQLEILRTQDRDQMAELLGRLATDDRVDVMAELDEELVNDLLSRFSAADRRDTMRLSQFPEGTAGAMMTTEVAKLKEDLTVREAMEELSRQAENYETIYYLYLVDDANHLRGVLSARRLVTAMKNPNQRIGDLMETQVVTVNAMDDQEKVANAVADLDLLAIPVVDDERRMLGIITHDDVIDVVHQEAIEDAHRIAAIQPLGDSYLRTNVVTLSRKRGVWLAMLFVGALFTTFLLDHFEGQLTTWPWLIAFIPILISSGGNSGNQSATLIITALSRGHVTLQDWMRVLFRELKMGLILGAMLAVLGFGLALTVGSVPGWYETLVLPITLLMVVLSGTLIGASLPLIFERIGWDPAMMSNPLVASLMDFIGVLIYLTTAVLLLSGGQYG